MRRLSASIQKVITLITILFTIFLISIFLPFALMNVYAEPVTQPSISANSHFIFLNDTFYIKNGGLYSLNNIMFHLVLSSTSGKLIYSLNQSLPEVLPDTAVYLPFKLKLNISQISEKISNNTIYKEINALFNVSGKYAMGLISFDIVYRRTFSSDQLNGLENSQMFETMEMI